MRLWMTSFSLEKLLVERKRAEEEEHKRFHSKAAFSSHHSRLKEVSLTFDHRLAYRKDVDRIVHSKGFSRYIDKTQVVYLIENDHVTYRGLHVQLVSHFARGIAEVLRLNTDLVEAIALGHDVGHPPFGHEGEEYLSELSLAHGEGFFAHPWQSCRLFSLIEPLDLGLAVYDGFLCHDGGMISPILEPRFGKTWKEHTAEKEAKWKDPQAFFIPATLEGCLVKVCDTMSYLGRDIEDAISLGIIQRDHVPKTHLGITNRDILNALAADLITHSFEKDYIAISEETLKALNRLREFNFKEIYTHPRLKVESNKIRLGYQVLFETFLHDLEHKKEKGVLWSEFIQNKSQAYQEESSSVRKVIDYIAGMTDHFFVRMLEKWVLPKRIDWPL